MKNIRGGGGLTQTPPLLAWEGLIVILINFFLKNIHFVEKVFDMYAVMFSSLFSQIVGLF